MTRRRSYWGWGYTDAAVSDEGRERLRMLVSQVLDMRQVVEETPLPIDDITLPPSRVSAPSALADILTSAPEERASHSYGKAYRDVVRGLAGDFGRAPDVVALPKSDEDVVRLLDWCQKQRYAAIPYGGGSSVVGGVEPRFRDAVPGVVTIDLRHIAGVREIDKTSRAALIDGGTYGPALEAALAPEGLTLRHYPQSFEQSTLGGWLATRAGGHFATLYTHIDDLVESMTVITPTGTLETRRLPASGAGPSPDRFFLGSEGALGIITRAWMRLQERPTFRASATFRFTDFYRAAEAARALAQAGLFPANCRLLDASEALINGVGDGVSCFLLVSFESADHPKEPWLARARELSRDAGGEPVDKAVAALPSAEIEGADESAGAAERWRKMFLRGPYLRDALVRMGLVIETFETAVVWRDFEVFHRRVKAAALDAATRVSGSALVSSRVTHVYPDGAAPYFTVIAPAKPGSQVAQWDEIKAAVSDAIIDAGGTITHHHAVGRDHQPFYARQRPEPFARVLAAAKRELDPMGILNPGVLVG